MSVFRFLSARSGQCRVWVSYIGSAARDEGWGLSVVNAFRILSARSAQGKVRTVCSAPAARGEGWGLRVLSARIAKCYATAVRGVWVCP